MKVRVSVGVMLLSLLACSHVLAASSSSLEAVIQGTPYALANSTNPAFQQGVVNDLSNKTGVNAGTVKTIIIDHTGGTLIPAWTAVADQVNNGNTIAQTPYQVIERLGNNNSGADGVQFSPRQAENVMRILSGETAVGPGTQVGMMTVEQIYGTVDERAHNIVAERKSLVDEFGSGSALASVRMNQNLMNRLWVRGLYAHQDMDSKDGFAGYKYKAWGGSIGYDHAFGPITIGAAFTYTRGDFEQKGFVDDNTIDNYGGSFYANYYNCNGFFANVYGGYNYGDNEVKTLVHGTGWLNGDNHTDTFWAGGNVGYEFKVNPNFSLTPTVGIYYSHSKSSSYTSTLNGSSFMDYHKISNRGWILPVQLMATYRMQLDDCSQLDLRLVGGYNYNLTNKGARGGFNYAGVNDVTSTIMGVKPGRHGWTAGAGVTYSRNRWDVSIDYRYDGKSKYDGHRVIGTFGINF